MLLAGPFAGEGYDLVCYLGGALLVCAGAIARDARKGTLATAILAFCSNAYLYSRKLESAAGDSRCNINDVMNCDIVNTSAASEMFGLPITLFGMAFYAGLALAAMLHERNTPRFFQISGLFAIVNLGYSAYLAWESKQLGAVCVVCISIYIANALLFWAAWKGLKEGESGLFDDLGSALTAWTTLILASTFGMVVLVGAGHWRAQGAASDPIERIEKHRGEEVDPNDPEVLAQLYSEPRGPITLDGSEPVLGNPDAPYQLVEWADYGCPHCARASTEVAQLVRENPDFSVRFKVFPLTSQCNPGIEADGGPERCRAAQATECARRQADEKFWHLSHLIFANQSHMDDDSLRFMAEQAELDMGAWNTCMDDDTVLEGIRADAMAGLRTGIFGTPSFFMKGTHGDTWIEVPAGVPAAYLLSEAHKNGVALKPPGPPTQP